MISQYIFTLFISLTPLFKIQSQENLNQVMIVQSYFVEHIIQSRIGPAHKPFYQKTISLNGQPQGEGKVRNMQLHFTSDDLKNTQNPEISDNLEKVTVWFPFEEFEHYYNMLRHKKGLMKAVFIQSESQQIRMVEIIVNGILPLSD